jgi:hypothetical protein
MLKYYVIICDYYLLLILIKHLIKKNSAEEPYNELDDFVTEDVWRSLLQLHLKATDQQKLRGDRVIITKLGIFVRQAVRAVIIAIKNEKDTQSTIRKLDDYTIDLKIPTKLGIVESLPVRELLDY